jgi:hypothetical protein
MKDRRRWPEGGEWEPIKIPHRNLAYIPNQTWRLSLLTRSRLHSYSKPIGPQNQVTKRSRNTNWCWQKNTCEIDDKNQTETQFMSSQAFHRTTWWRVWEPAIWERLEQRNLELFDPITQERTGFPLQAQHIGFFDTRCSRISETVRELAVFIVHCRNNHGRGKEKAAPWLLQATSTKTNPRRWN